LGVYYQLVRNASEDRRHSLVAVPHNRSYSACCTFWRVTCLTCSSQQALLTFIVHWYAELEYILRTHSRELPSSFYVHRIFIGESFSRRITNPKPTSLLSEQAKLLRSHPHSEHRPPASIKPRLSLTLLTHFRQPSLLLD